MKKFCMVLAFMFIIIAGGGLAGCGGSHEIKNVIIIIGDGMGFNHLANAKTYFDIDEFVFDEDFFASVTTRSNEEVTDSAAAATAIATGHKVNNYEVGMHEGEKYRNIMEIARDYGKRTGIITSDSLVGATPAAFSSHVPNRDDSHEIIYNQVNSGIDLFVTAQCSEYYDHIDLFEAHEYELIDTLDGLENLDPSHRGVAVFDSLISYYNEESTDETNFNSALTYTLDYLDHGKDGFCLMIENAYIDKYSHGNDLYGAMCEVKMFADTIRLVYEFCKDRDDTAVFITADHETGGLQLAQNKTEMSNSLYTKSNHSASNVPLYAKNIPFDPREVVDNTDIFSMMNSIITGEKFE